MAKRGKSKKNSNRGFASQSRQFIANLPEDVAYIMGAVVALRSVGEDVQHFQRNISDPQSAFNKICKMRGTTASEKNHNAVKQIARYIKQIYQEVYATALPAKPHMIERNRIAEVV